MGKPRSSVRVSYREVTPKKKAAALDTLVKEVSQAKAEGRPVSKRIVSDAIKDCGAGCRPVIPICVSVAKEIADELVPPVIPSPVPAPTIGPSPLPSVSPYVAIDCRAFLVSRSFIPTVEVGTVYYGGKKFSPKRNPVGPGVNIFAMYPNEPWTDIPEGEPFPEAYNMEYAESVVSPPPGYTCIPMARHYQAVSPISAPQTSRPVPFALAERITTQPVSPSPSLVKSQVSSTNIPPLGGFK